MKPVSNEILEQQLNWRYATQEFDPKKKIAPRDWETLIKALTLAPSSFGLQPWKFVIVENPELRKKLTAASWQQPQIEQASHLVVLAVLKTLLPSDVDHWLNRISEVRGLDPNQLKDQRQSMLEFVAQGPGKIDFTEWATRQAFISMGFFLTTAALLGIDACPMEGIVCEQYDQILGLVGTRFQTAVVVTAGYRADSDPICKLAKVRFPDSETVEVR